MEEEGNPNPLGCFFNEEDQGRVMGQLAIESCAATCGINLQFPNCKLCPENVNGFEFGVDTGEEQCNLCPNDDVQYPRQDFPLFGEGIKCWQVQKFFKSAEVPADAPNCRLAQMMNYVCGCAGPGYGGASTETKKVVFAWLPRIMAILSVLVSVAKIDCVLGKVIAFVLTIATYSYRAPRLSFTILVGLRRGGKRFFISS